MPKHLLIFLSFISFVFNVSCNKNKLKAPAAAFLVVPSVSVATDYASQGTNSHKITDMWYYINGEFKGAFPIGGVMPIPATGNVDITLMAGIKNNGISATRQPYAAYNSKSYTLNVIAGQNYTLTPAFEYNSTAYFYYKDDFDNAVGQGQYFGSDGNNNCRLTFPAEAYLAYGGIGGCYIMTMTDAQPTARLLQTTGYYLPSGGATIYVELNYKCNQEITVGIYGGTNPVGGGTGVFNDKRGAVTISKSDEWNKIYVQLTSIVSAAPTYPSYKVYVEANKLVDNPEIYIDNIKLIYQ